MNRDEMYLSLGVSDKVLQFGGSLPMSSITRSGTVL